MLVWIYEILPGAILAPGNIISFTGHASNLIGKWRVEKNNEGGKMILISITLNT
jgi:hypothetical protein